MYPCRRGLFVGPRTWAINQAIIDMGFLANESVMVIITEHLRVKLGGI